ncbi:hypothetical protein B296_00046855 [Ensete ventricosum]|uniref:Uncharacterized protein n=1 Tax=Ensete ventricosum TaxID=4639 RepID=A0A426YJ75_ENSVE|nr:hypothetical protein B296_00046855 [Ensete ventricosum]
MLTSNVPKHYICFVVWLAGRRRGRPTGRRGVLSQPASSQTAVRGQIREAKATADFSRLRDGLPPQRLRTVAEMLAEALDCSFLEADDFHSQANKGQFCIILVISFPWPFRGIEQRQTCIQSTFSKINCSWTSVKDGLGQ